MQVCRVRECGHVGYLTREREAVEAIGIGELERGEDEGVESTETGSGGGGERRSRSWRGAARGEWDAAAAAWGRR
jgi:hypothetical protein